MWKTLRVSHIPTPSAATTDKLQTRRYTNNLLGTKDRSGHSLGPRPVDSTLRKSRTHLFNNYFVQQRYEDDDQESPEEEQERLHGVPAGCREGDVSELDT